MTMDGINAKNKKINAAGLVVGMEMAILLLVLANLSDLERFRGEWEIWKK